MFRFPPPFRAALAVSSDIDYTTPGYFLDLHAFVNGNGQTRFGRGLGLDIADSFWFYRANPEISEGISYFEGTCEKEKDAAVIREGIQQGRIDTLHAYGDFSLGGGFRRELAERALSRLGLSVPIWINHGDDHNFQNVLAPGTYGDLPEKRSAGGWPSRPVEYHADLFGRLGIQFIWTGDLTCVVGQERPCSAWEYYRAHRAGARAGPAAAWVLDRLARAAGATLPGRVFRRGIEHLGYPVRGRNDLVWLDRLRDGRSIWRFQRFGDFTRDCIEDLTDVLSEEILDRLVANEGAMVLFTHFGKSRVLQGSARELPAGAAEAFRRLARFRDAGKIWVARTSRLLRHLVVLKRLSAWREGDLVALEWQEDPVLGSLGDLRDLATVAVRVGEGEVRRIVSAGRALPAGVWRAHGAGSCAWIDFANGSLAETV